MALQFLLPLFTSLASSGIGGALAAGTTSAANKREAEMAELRRAMLMRMKADILGGAQGAGDAMDQQAIRDFSRASDQIGAQAASTGMTNAGRGGQDALQAETLGALLAQLAQAKQQDDLQRQQLVTQLINDPSFTIPDPDSINVGADSFHGLLGGLASGGLNTMASFMGTDTGMQMLMDMFGGANGGTSKATGNRLPSIMSLDPNGPAPLTPFSGGGNSFLSAPRLNTRNVEFAR